MTKFLPNFKISLKKQTKYRRHKIHIDFKDFVLRLSKQKIENKNIIWQKICLKKLK